MTMSPYDNLPVGKYEEVTFEPLKASGSPDPDTSDSRMGSAENTENPYEKPAQPTEKTLQYVDVPIENVPDETAADMKADTEDSSGMEANTNMENSSGTEAVSSDASPQITESASEQRYDDSTEDHNEEHFEIVLPEVPQTAAVSLPTSRPSGEFTKKTAMSDPSLKYSNIALKNLWDIGEYILPFEETLLVPDTMPDMSAILFADGSISTQKSADSEYKNTDHVSGEITAYTVYKPASTSAVPVDVVKSSVSFKTDKCWGNAEGDSFRVSLSLRSISAEMVNERKFIIKGSVCISLTQIAAKTLKVFDGTGCTDLCQLESTAHAISMVSETTETTEISQEINLHEDQPAPLKILKENYSIIENHRQITSGKLVVNGTILSDILYIGQEDDDRRLCSINNKIDFTQFIVMDEDVDPDLMRITFTGDSLKATIESRNLFMIQGQVITAVCCYENRQLTMISDAYHKKEEIAFDIAQQQLSAVAGTVSGEISSREVVSIEDTGKRPETLVCGCSRISEVNGHMEKGRIIIEGSADVKILALDEDESPFIISSAVPLRGSLEMSDAAEDAEIKVSAAVKEFWFDSINSRQLEINAGICLNVWAITRENFRTIENLCLVELKEPPKHIPMALYIVGHGDTLWDISKRYKSDPETLAALNGIDAEKPPAEGSKLFIMK